MSGAVIAKKRKRRKDDRRCIPRDTSYLVRNFTLVTPLYESADGPVVGAAGGPVVGAAGCSCPIGFRVQF